MIRINFPIFSFVLIAFMETVSAQVVSVFDFNSTATIANATVGPNATAVDPAAFVTGGRVKMPSAPNGPVIGPNLTVPGSPYFDVDWIDIVANYEGSDGELTGYFFQRGGLKFGWEGSNLIAYYRVSDGSSGFIDHVLSSTFEIDTVNARNYRFRYNDVSGTAEILVGSTVVASATTVVNSRLYWNLAGSAYLAYAIDNNFSYATDKGLSSISISGGLTSLPVTFISISTHRSTSETVELMWTVNEANEYGYYEVLMSEDGVQFTSYPETIALHANGIRFYKLNVDVSGMLYFKIQHWRDGRLESESPIVRCKAQHGVYAYASNQKLYIQNPEGLNIRSIEVWGVNGNSIQMKEVNAANEFIEMDFYSKELTFLLVKTAEQEFVYRLGF